MVKFEDLYLNSSDYGLKFYNQRLVKLFGRIDGKDFCHTLTKDDVIFCIKSYISRIRLYDKDIVIRSEKVNFLFFKMHDLVPYLYTLVNLYLTKSYAYDTPYSRVLPDFKLTRFCRLPFEDEIVVNEKPLCNVKYAVLPALGDDNDTKCVCRLPSGRVLVEDTFKALELHLSNLFPMYRIHLYCDMPF